MAFKNQGDGNGCGKPYVEVKRSEVSKTFVQGCIIMSGTLLSFQVHGNSQVSGNTKCFLKSTFYNVRLSYVCP